MLRLAPGTWLGGLRNMTHYSRLLVVSLTGWLVGCGAPKAPVATVTPVLPLPVASVAANFGGPELPLTPDPIAGIIVQIHAEFDAGQRELKARRLVAARTPFDLAVNQLLALPGGARNEPRLAVES